MVDANDCEPLAAIRERYLEQLASTDAQEPESDLLRALGPLQVGAQGHRRAVYLCLAAVRRPLVRWGLPTLGPATEIASSVTIAEQCVVDPSSVDVARVSRASALDRGFIASTPCSEVEFYARAVYRSVAALVRFSLYGGLPDGAEALEWSHLADTENGALGQPFDRWLVETALPAAWFLRRLSDEELNPLIQPKATHH